MMGKFDRQVTGVWHVLPFSDMKWKMGGEIPSDGCLVTSGAWAKRSAGEP